MNAVSVIFPYRLEGVWVFDDAAAGLVREPFISGADIILDVLTEHIPEAANGIQNHLLGKTLSRLHRPIRLDSNRILEAIGIAGKSGKWKDGCVRPSSNISKALPKKSSCRRPLKGREIRRCAQ